MRTTLQSLERRGEEKHLLLFVFNEKKPMLVAVATTHHDGCPFSYPATLAQTNTVSTRRPAQVGQSCSRSNHRLESRMREIRLSRSEGRGTGTTRSFLALSRREPTTLDRVHAAMLLQAGGQVSALRAMLGAETSAPRTSSGSPTPFQPLARSTAKKSACLMLCYWRRGRTA
jgi:hypothetical protein